jgi:hypothetical protein
MKLKKKPFNLANKIRTLLLVHINKELLKIKQENKKHFLINSKEPEQYDEYYNTFTIIERSLIDSSSSFLNKTSNNFFNFFQIPNNKSIDEEVLPRKKITISKRRNAIVKIEKRNSKNINFYLKKKKYETQQKFINHNIKILRYFCYNLKSKIAIIQNKQLRNNSEVIRRKKYEHIKNKSYVLTLKTDAIKTRRKIQFEDSNSVIKLHRIGKLKKSTKNVMKKMKDFDYLKEYKNEYLSTRHDDLIFD